MTKQQKREFISLPELAKRTGYSKRTIYNKTSMGLLKKYKPFGGKIFYDWNEITQLIEKSTDEK